MWKVCFTFRTSSLLPTLTTFCPGLTLDPACLTKWSTLSSGGGGRSRSRGSLCSTAMLCSVKLNKTAETESLVSSVHLLHLWLVSHHKWHFGDNFEELCRSGGHRWELLVWRPQKINGADFRVEFYCQVIMSVFLLIGQQLVVLKVNLEIRINS